MEYSDDFKVQVLDALKDGESKVSLAKEYNVSRRTIMLWEKDEEAIRGRYQRKGLKDKVVALDGELGAVAEYEKKYLDKLESLGAIEDRKRVFVGGLEKVMWDILGSVDNDGFEDLKSDVKVRMLKDLNEMREKLSGEPSVIVEYRAKFQMNVMRVVQKIMPEKAEEFLTEIKMMEED